MNDSIAAGAYDYARELGQKHMAQAKSEDNGKLLGQLYFGLALGFYRANPDGGIPYLDSAIVCAERVGDVSMNMRALNAKSSFLKKLGKLREAKRISLKAFDVSREKAQDRLFLSSWNVSINYRNLGQYDSALFYITIADSLAQRSNNQRDQYLALQGASNIYLDMGNYQEALKVIRKLPEGQSEGDKMYEKMNLGVAYLGLNKPDSALIAFESSITLAISRNDSIEISNLLGHLTKTYISLNDTEKAIESIKHSLSLSMANGTKDSTSQNNLTLAELLYDKEQFREALSTSSLAFEIAKSMDHEHLKLDALEILANSNAALSRYQEAFRYSRTAKELLRVVNENERLAKVEELKAIYETNQKEREIAVLAQENRIKDLQLNQQRIVTIASLIVSILVAVSGILFYRQHQTRAKQKQLKLEQDVLRTQMNPHFIFNALASIQGLITRNKRKEAATYLAKFGELTRDILEVSRKELIPITKEIDMIHNYVHLEQIRFSKSLKLEVKKDGFGDADELLVPPMTLQPFIENSIKHGFRGRDSGLVSVEIKKKDNYLYFSVLDDGVGLKKGAFEKSNSLAISIFKGRLRSIKKYAKNLALHVADHLDASGQVKGVVVKFNLPVVYAH